MGCPTCVVAAPVKRLWCCIALRLTMACFTFAALYSDDRLCCCVGRRLTMMVSQKKKKKKKKKRKKKEKKKKENAPGEAIKREHRFNWDATEVIAMANTKRAREFPETWCSSADSINHHVHLDTHYEGLYSRLAVSCTHQ
ncbi:unnamed protein product [Schistocephalus solidus]|uniref:Secreted protein n=1 Tax=Schistocephalus solidus TaxID=70667 RepID=A0A183S788_SCHSO|nr:unnamed protein product [Schistocephalus solidus]